MGNSNKKTPIIPIKNEWIDLEKDDTSQNAISEYNKILEEHAKEQLFDIFNEINTKVISNKFRFNYLTFEKYFHRDFYRFS